MKSWQSRVHILHSLWLSPAGSWHKPWRTSCSGLSLRPMLSFTLWSPRGLEVRGYTWWKQGSAVAKLGHPAGFAGEAWMPAVLQQCLTVGPVFRQSDRSQPEHPENPGTLAPRMHHPANIYILLSTCLFLRSWLGLCLFILPSLESLSWVLPLFRSPSPPSTRLALVLSCFSLCLSLPLLLRFNKSPGGRREKTGGVKTSMALFTKGPGIAWC